MAQIPEAFRRFLRVLAEAFSGLIEPAPVAAELE